MFLSAPNAKTPFSFQSAAAGCLLAPAARYWALRFVILDASARLNGALKGTTRRELKVKGMSCERVIYIHPASIKLFECQCEMKDLELFIWFEVSLNIFVAKFYVPECYINIGMLLQ